jgi:hypothetical protein
MKLEPEPADGPVGVRPRQTQASSVTRRTQCRNAYSVSHLHVHEDIYPNVGSLAASLQSGCWWYGCPELRGVMGKVGKCYRSCENASADVDFRHRSILDRSVPLNWRKLNHSESPGLTRAKVSTSPELVRLKVETVVKFQQCGKERNGARTDFNSVATPLSLVK